MSNSLFRSVRDRRIAGVCGGLGQNLNIDSNIIRLIWAFFILVYGAGFLFYILAWIIIPEDPSR